jgi:hypothetical protein
MINYVIYTRVPYLLAIEFNLIIPVLNIRIRFKYDTIPRYLSWDGITVAL